jgi:hypothetical protein
MAPTGGGSGASEGTEPAAPLLLLPLLPAVLGDFRTLSSKRSAANVNVFDSPVEVGNKHSTSPSPCRKSTFPTVPSGSSASAPFQVTSSPALKAAFFAAYMCAYEEKMKTQIW